MRMVISKEAGVRLDVISQKEGMDGATGKHIALLEAKSRAGVR